MDVWERTVRKLIVSRSKLAVRILNEPNTREGKAVVREQEQVGKGIHAKIRLAILALKLNSKSTKVVEWASGRAPSTPKVV